MKTKKTKKKLTLQKETIATLSEDKQQKILGGIGGGDTNTCTQDGCQVSFRRC